ncbi:MAG: murein L,D-transpeptidase YafK [Desulforhopalus sp.]|jgi:murein L,D-transpeptidase YafK
MLFEQGESLKHILTFTCATGENPRTKKISGDAKTPEGVYFITEISQDNEITVFGSRAFHLDYPNVFFDKYDGNNGDGIFIHGTNKTLIPYSTNGCITLNNYDGHIGFVRKGS